MAPRAHLPAQLADGPFSLAEARRAGLTRRQLQSSGIRRLGPMTYVSASSIETPSNQLNAVRHRLPATAVFSGHTAAWLHELDDSLRQPIEVTIPNHAGVSGRAGMLIRRAALDPVDVLDRKALRVTSVLRTLADLALSLSLTEGVVLADAALQKRLITKVDLDAYVASHRGRKGIKRLRRIAEFAEPGAESKMESRLRMVLILAGLPRPELQVPIYDSTGSFLGRTDLYYREQRLAIEFDGGIHRDRLVDDNRRQNLILSAKVGLLRFTSSDVYGAPDTVATQVRTALRSR